jgi:hypothetical protein
MNARDVAKLYRIVDVLRLDPTKKIWVCPFPQHLHSSYTPSLGISYFAGGEHFSCFGSCGLQGDVIDAVGFMSIPNYRPHDREHVARAIGLLQTGFEPQEPRPVEKPVALSWEAYKSLEDLDKRVIDYGKSRGLAAETLKKWGVKSKAGAMAIPVFHFGTLVALKYRATWPDPRLRYWSEPGSRRGLFGYSNVYMADAPVAVVKGEIAAIMLDQIGILACAPSSGENDTAEEFKSVLGFSKKIVVIGDNDPAPETRKKMQKAAADRARALGAELRFPPEGYKDVDLWILKDPSAASVIRSWLND